MVGDIRVSAITTVAIYAGYVLKNAHQGDLVFTMNEEVVKIVGEIGKRNRNCSSQFNR